MKSLCELKQLVKSETSVDDLVAAIIFKSQEEKIPKSQAFFQQAFFQLQQHDPDTFSEFIFDESGISPFSDELDSVMFRLESATILSTLNPTYRAYAITCASEALQSRYDKFSTQQKAKIDQSAILFSQLVHTQE